MDPVESDPMHVTNKMHTRKQMCKKLHGLLTVIVRKSGAFCQYNQSLYHILNAQKYEHDAESDFQAMRITVSEERTNDVRTIQVSI